MIQLQNYFVAIGYAGNGSIGYNIRASSENDAKLTALRNLVPELVEDIKSIIVIPDYRIDKFFRYNVHVIFIDGSAVTISDCYGENGADAFESAKRKENLNISEIKFAEATKVTDGRVEWRYEKHDN